MKFNIKQAQEAADRDQQELNTVENKRPNPIEYKPFVSDIKIIFSINKKNI